MDAGTGVSEFDVVIVGGSFAGLSAAMLLARARRRILVLNEGSPRNRFAAHSHGFFGQDGRPPREILAEARRQLEAYPSVHFLDQRATRVTSGKGFTLETANQTFRSRRLILAYGVRDILPDVPGIAELWGESVFHCPFCHGYEYRDRPLGVLGDGARALHQALMLPDWSDDVILFTNGPSALRPEDRDRLARRGVEIEETPVARLVADGRDLQAVELVDGRQIRRAGLLIGTSVVPNSDLAESLGCLVDEGPLGTLLRVDARQETTVPGVYAAGDLARMPHSVTFAVGDGYTAAMNVYQSLLAEDCG